MAHANVDIKEKMIDLPGTSLSIWKAHPDALREQDKNARIMDVKTFQRLTENIKNSKQLESLPYCYRTVSPGGSEELSIISGHHRVRAARKAGLTELYVLVEERDLSKAQVTAKQLAHNALAGIDDEQMLAELYASIDDINAKLEAGIFSLESTMKEFDVKADDIKIDFDYEQIVLLFLRHEYDNFNAILQQIEDDLKETATVGICTYEQFEQYRRMIQEVSKVYDVRNLPAVMNTLVVLARESLKLVKELSSVYDIRNIPALMANISGLVRGKLPPPEPSREKAPKSKKK
jgi:hypothetical protein